MTLALCGDFDAAEARMWIEKYWGGIPAGPALDRPTRWMPILHGEKVVEVNDQVAQERVYLAFPAPGSSEPGCAELDLAASIFTDGLSSRLHQALVLGSRTCTDVSASYLEKELAGFFLVAASVLPGASLAEAERIIGQEIARFAQDGPTEAELARAKTGFEMRFISSLESIGNRADLLAQYNTLLGDPARFEQDLARFRQASPEGVRQTADRWLNHRNRVVVRFHPEPSARIDGPLLDRSIAPAPAPDHAFLAPAVRSARLANGLAVLVVERPDLPQVTAALMSRSGAVTDPPGLEGRAALAFQCVDKGTRTRTAVEIEDALADLGTAIQARNDREGSHLAFKALKRNFEAALELLAEVVLAPDYPEDAVAMERQAFLAALAQVATNPRSVAARLAPRLIFGKGHPYGRPTEGTPASMAALTREDLLAFHYQFLRPDNSALVFAGGITLEEATVLAERCFGEWSGQAAPVPAIPAASPLPGKVFAVDWQDASQTVIHQILHAPAKRSGHRPALQLVNNVWGGGFQSRLNMNLREDKGYSYGASSSLRQRRSAGLWQASCDVQADRTLEAVEEFLKELAMLGGDRPVSGQELADAKANRLRGYPQNFETLSDLAGAVGYVWLEGQPMSQLQADYDAAAAVTLASVRAAAGQYLLPQEARLLLVGDRKRILAAASGLGLGPVVFLDAEGEVVPVPG